MKKKIVITSMILILLLSSLVNGSMTNKDINEKSFDTKSIEKLRYVPGEVIVVLKNEGSFNSFSSDFLINEYGANSVENKFNNNIFKTYVDEDTESDYISNIKDDPRVKHACLNFIFEICKTPNDPSYDEQWGLEKIRCPKAWDTTTGDKNKADIWILDTGIQRDHFDLKKNIISNGYDFVNLSSETRSNYEKEGYMFLDGEDYTDDDANPDDFLGHGTGCAGVAGAVGNNADGVCGVNWDCSLVAIRTCFTIKYIDEHGYTIKTALTDMNAVFNAILNAEDNGADVISMSWGILPDEINQDGIDALQYFMDIAWDAGIVLVAASGNDESNEINYPAKCNNVIAVGAVDKNLNRCQWSNYGSGLDIMAPGKDIKTTDINNKFQEAIGTSFACPHVAGVAALAFAREDVTDENNNGRKNDEIKQLLEDTADDIGGGKNEYGNGLLDASLTYDTNLEITKPKDDSLYILNEKTDDYAALVIIGAIDVEVEAENKKGIEKVEFYVYDELKHTDKNETYEWYLDQKTPILMDYIKVLAYDTFGNVETALQPVLLYINPFNSFGNEVIDDDNILKSTKTSQNNKNKVEFTAQIPNAKEIIENDLDDTGISFSFDYKFDYGDGNIETYENIEDFQYIVEHTYKEAGSYEASVEITAYINIDVGCDADGEYKIDLYGEKTEEIPQYKNKIFNILLENNFFKIRLEKIFNLLKELSPIDLF